MLNLNLSFPRKRESMDPRQKHSGMTFGFVKWLIPIGILSYVYFPTFAWMYDRWMATDSYFGHGILIPLVTAFWIFRKKEELKFEPIQSDILGLWFLIFGVCLQIFSSLFRIYFLSAFSFVIILIGAVDYLFGRKIFSKIWFPLLFLFLMIPLPLLVITELTFKMKMMVANAATAWLNASGLPAIQEGSYIRMPNAFVLVGDPCSGLRSFLAFLCLGIVFAYGGALNWWKRILLVSLALPLAIISNIGRVYGLSALSEIYGMDFVHRWIHDPSGILVFVFALVIFIWIRSQLEGARHAA